MVVSVCLSVCASCTCVLCVCFMYMCVVCVLHVHVCSVCANVSSEIVVSVLEHGKF